MEVLHENGHYTPTAPKARNTLALLLSRANQVVEIPALIDELWTDCPPRSAVTTAQTYIYQLRKMLCKAVGSESAGEILVTKAPGYSLRIGDGVIDAQVFEQRSAEGKRLLAAGRPEEASRRLQEALALWRGPALSDVNAGRILEAHVVQLEESRLGTLQLRIEADMKLRRFRELVPELRSLVATHPLNEWLHAQLITCLRYSGRRGEALQAYQSLRRVLDDELGLHPSLPLQRLEQYLLTDPVREEVAPVTMPVSA
ncbi:AfsR/SARP family transcriptional regulator [Streptomyces sp. NBC_00249]|uniref:AfsR/SARP family transcriptional regulator n=1 Tax=Streptomyces sp. NBC_00249 TaxID=2975690 RepID=UPI00225325D5|nr:AfsR/SARP family transcriptional regulator [Streptomyces sp. NBC_00249]MCX5199468.1 AfsR/SARP family transcriptional regulator [Streptomyces sp. NBC_00249]